MTKWLSLYIQHSYMLLRHKRPATPPQLLHEWQTFRNFAIVKQNKKITLSTGKFFFLDRKKILSFECWILNYRQSRFWIIQFWIVSWRWTRNLSGKSKLNDSKSKLKNLNTKTWTQNLNTKTWTQNLNTKLELNNSKLKTEQLKIGFADNSKLKIQNSKLRSAQQFKTQNSKLKTLNASTRASIVTFSVPRFTTVSQMRR